MVADPATVKGAINKNGTVGAMCRLSGRIKSSRIPNCLNIER